MIAWWMAQLALLGSLLAIAAVACDAALRIARLPTRGVWITALGLTVMLGALATRRPVASEPVRIPSAKVSTVVAATQPVDGMLAAMRRTWHAVGERASARVRTMWSVWERAAPPHADVWLLAAWSAASGTLLLAFTGVHLRYRRSRTNWPRRVLQDTPVRIAPATGPAVIGVTDTEIVVPQWLLERDDREQRLVLEHELEHVRQHDPMLLALAQGAVVLLPWHPAVWYMASRLRLAVELDCDRRVLRRGASTREYGSLLIDLTDHRTGFGSALPAFSYAPSHLERRLIAMTPTRLKYPLVRALAAATVASLALLAACEAKVPTSDEIDHMTASSATAVARQVAIIDTAAVAYYVDNVRVSKEVADKIAAERIASVNVLQKGVQSGGEVRITTAKAASGNETNPPNASLPRMTYTRTDAVPAPDSAGLTAKQAAESKPRTGFTGLVIIDGAASDVAAMNRLVPDRIASVNVIKGASATTQYSDPRAANGVIVVHTKAAKK